MFLFVLIELSGLFCIRLQGVYKCIKRNEVYDQNFQSGFHINLGLEVCCTYFSCIQSTTFKEAKIFKQKTLVGLKEIHKSLAVLPTYICLLVGYYLCIMNLA